MVYKSDATVITFPVLQAAQIAVSGRFETLGKLGSTPAFSPCF
jgi:hypothetical protein